MNLHPELLERINAHLHDSSLSRDDIESLLLCSSDGHEIASASYHGSKIEPTQLSAMAASFAGLSLTIATSCGKKGALGGIVETADGLIICGLINTVEVDYVLLGIFAKGVQHGLALWSFRNQLSDFQKLLDSN